MDEQARATIILAAATLAAARLARLPDIPSAEDTVVATKMALKYMVRQGLVAADIEKSS